MPMYEYRCDCGKTFDVLVRRGREPLTCDETADRSLSCAGTGRLSRLLSAVNVGNAANQGSGDPAPGGGCGACGAPESCQSD